MRRRKKIEPLVLTRRDVEMQYDRIMLRMQWFALGVSASCLALAVSLPGFWQTAAVMFAVAFAIGFIRRRFSRWNDFDTVRGVGETAAVYPAVKATRM